MELKILSHLLISILPSEIIHSLFAIAKVLPVSAIFNAKEAPDRPEIAKIYISISSLINDSKFSIP